MGGGRAWSGAPHTAGLIAIQHAFNSDEFIFKGTVIRVFSIPQGKRLFEFRRGVRRYFLLDE